MRRDPKPAKSKEAKPPVARKPFKDDDTKVRDLEKGLADSLQREDETSKRLAQALGQLETRDRELTEALDQQTATSEILRVISSSATNLQLVLDTVAQSAARLCGANDAQIFRVEGDAMRRVARFGSLATLDVVPLTRSWVASRSVIDRQVVHVLDRAVEVETEFPEGLDAQRRIGHRTTLAVPLLRERDVIGSIFIARTEVRPFSDTQIGLLKTFADQAVIAIENVRLFNETKEALERQTATSEILRVISSSPTDVQPVLDAVAETATRLCGAIDALIYRVEAGMLLRVAHFGSVPSVSDARPVTRETVTGRSIIERRAIHVHDLLDERAHGEYAETGSLQGGIRTVLCVPLTREDSVLGAITIRRMELDPFTEPQIELLKTFADQAVIAIENVRLFKETKEALERQTATSEILRVISISPTDVQPVFDVIARSAARLCEAVFGGVIAADGDQLTQPAAYGPEEPVLEGVRESFPMPITRDSVAGRAILEQRVVHVEDLAAESTYGAAPGHRLGTRTILSVPMLRDSSPVGAITVWRREVRPFTTTQIALLQTFADQAVIAIENVRLFTELQEKNRALTQAHGQVTEALEQQTATSEILRVISSSHTDLQPVFDTIARNAVRLCDGVFGALMRFDGDQLHLVAQYNFTPHGLKEFTRAYPRPPLMDSSVGRAILIHSVDQVPDTEQDPSPFIRHLLQALGCRAQVSVPLLRNGNAIGVIGVARREPGPFSEAQIELLKTFADQAVIAIENARLLTELQARTQELSRSVGELQALGEVGQAVSSSLDLETVLTTIVSRAVQLSGLDGGVVLEYDQGAEEFVHRAQAETGGALAAARRATRIRKGEGVIGRTAITLEPIQVSDITVPGAYVGPNRENLIESGVRAILAVPMVHQGRLIGCLGVTRDHPGDFPAATAELLRNFATQSALAIQNARLFREIEEKSHQLEVASQHKSEFLANMSHELRTPLNAIIGFSEVLSERMFGELNEKQEEYLKDIYASGTHLLSLINDILDLSKIEAGRMELELTDFDLPTALDSALTLVRERAGRRSITVQMIVDDKLGQIQADERKVRQVVLNLLSNAIKFTPEGGRIEVGAAAKDGVVEVSVSDTGVGIAPEDQEAVFEEFRQAGTAEKKVEGTGLGLTLCRKFVELHGGKIWVKSQVGVGSTFTFTIPVRRGE